MTGYARVRRSLPTGAVTVSIKAVNHRGLDLHCYLGPDLEPIEIDIRNAVKQRVVRGHLDLRVSVEQEQAQSGFAINEAVLAEYLRVFGEARERFAIEAKPDLNVVLRYPGILKESESAVSEEVLFAEVKSALDTALTELNAVREREGGELRKVMLEVLQHAMSSVDVMAAERLVVLPALQQRIQERLQEVLKQVTVEPQRILQEAAFLADRSDIAEELARLRIHCRRLTELLDEPAEVGKKVDFLMQEMNREANTILSKTSALGELGLEITRQGLSLKADIEKIREQCLNLE